MDSAKRGIAFYVETLVLVLFLSIALAVLVQVFAASQRLGTQAQRLSDGTLLAENVAEMLAASESEPEFRSLLGADEDGEIRLQYNLEDGILQEAEDGEYRLDVSVNQAQVPAQVQIVVSYDEQEIYRLQTAKLWPQGA